MAFMSLETILLVHDDACIRSVVRAVLQQFGYEVLEAGSDEEAIHLATASRFAIDLLLTDIGTESAGHLKDLQPGMKVLCISGSAKESTEYQGEQEYTVISKPLKPHLLARKIREVLDKPESLRSAELNCPLQYRFRDLDPSHPYFARHGITSKTARHFGAGFFPGPGRMAGRIVVPIHNEEGELIAYAGHAIDEAEPKRKYWPDFNRSRVLFNYRAARWLITEFALTVVVVDGFFDCMKVHQAGFPSVVSLTGPSLSEEQEQLLSESFYSIVLLLNGPEPTRRIASQLMKRSFVRVLADPAGRPPHDLCADEIMSLMCGLTEYSGPSPRRG
jgi:CheY-like chemotaxis protein